METILGTDALVQVAGPLKDFAERLSGPDAEEWFNAFKRFLRKESPWDCKTVWRTITIGGSSKDELLKRLKDNGFFVSDWACDIMGKPAFSTASKPTDVQLVRVKVSDFGFTEASTTTELFARAKEYGLELCPAEVGPYLRLADENQRTGTWYWIVMESITDSGGSPRVFGVGRDGDGRRWLGAACAGPCDRWVLEGVFVFCLRK